MSGSGALQAVGPSLESFEFGSVSGSVVAFCFFLAWAALVGFIVYGLLRHPGLRRLRFRNRGRAAGGVAALAGVATTLVIVSLVYFTMLDGFYRVEVQGNELRLHYILPSRTRTLPREEIRSVRSAFAYRFRWRLILRTTSGAEYASTPSEAISVEEAVQGLTRLLSR